MKKMFSLWFAFLILVGVFFISFLMVERSNPVDVCGVSDSDCIARVALLLENESLCESAVDSGECYTFMALKNESSEFCYLSNSSDECFLRVAVISENVSVCSLSVSSESEDKCYFEVAILSGNLSVCDLAQSPERCIYSYAGEVGDSSICSRAGNYRDKCYELFG
ncbi:MAG: hypothetical protein ACOCXG_04725 [Nanoarchaeota archaeon]